MTKSLLLFAVIAVTVGNIMALCVPGYWFKKNCNVCTCQQNGFYKCTENVCPFPQPPRRDNTTSCTPGENFKRDCNDCKCGLDGKPASCTRKACDKSNPSMPAKVSNTSFSCTPGKRIKNNNILCTCSATGLSLISCMDVYRRDPPIYCTPGAHFKKDCNDCICGSNGRTASCSRKRC